MTDLRDLTEKQWARQVVELAQLTGWRRYHTYRSERSPAGFPDEVLVRDRIVYIELKTETGKLSPAQADWLRALAQAGGEVYVARPRHFDDLAMVLRRRADLGRTQTLTIETDAILELAEAAAA